MPILDIYLSDDELLLSYALAWQNMTVIVDICVTSTVKTF